ncbi:helix-hairpin-helix domain-containing protein [Sulfurimonas sp.]|uniref:ComEA family DNA-binding protein n=1 Tax=Sulfurimonas sp. TaxID=2022749 RepID=UPI002B49E9F3|nr:helix-hairpin-helix domain-containing protein [Sulfurimonas sp.]
MKLFVMIILGFSLLFGSVDINTASKKELSSLNGIGTIKAEAIIAYRKTNCFKNVKELAKVKGIGNKTVEKNKSDLTASPCK